MKKLLFVLAVAALLGGLALGLSASTTQATTVHYCTLADDGATETLALGEDLVLNLGSGYTWKAGVIDPFGHPVMQKVWLKNGNPTYAYFQSTGYGQSTIRAYGTPNCAPRCDQIPDKQFQLNVIVQ